MKVLDSTQTAAYVSAFGNSIEERFLTHEGLFQTTLEGVRSTGDEGKDIAPTDLVAFSYFITHHKVLLGHHLLRVAASHLKCPLGVRLEPKLHCSDGVGNQVADADVSFFRIRGKAHGTRVEQKDLGEALIVPPGMSSNILANAFFTAVKQGLLCAGYVGTTEGHFFEMAPEKSVKADSDCTLPILLDRLVSPVGVWL